MSLETTFASTNNYVDHGMVIHFIIHSNISTAYGVFSFLRRKEYDLHDKKRDD